MSGLRKGTGKTARGANDGRAKVAAEVARLQEWQTRKADAEARLAELRATSGAALLDDPDRAKQAGREITELMEFSGMADRAISAAEANLHEARVAAARIEADRWDGEAARRRAKLEQHDKRTDELLAELAEHEGRFISVRQASRLMATDVNYGADVAELLSNGALKSDPLHHAVEEAEIAAQAIRCVIDGGDPVWIDASGKVKSQTGGVGRELLPEELPDAVYGGNAILPAPRYLSAVERGQRDVRQLDERAEWLRATIEVLEADARQRPHLAASKHREAERRRRELEEIPAKAERLRERLSKLAS